MLRKAFMPETKLVPLTGMARTMGSPPVWVTPPALVKMEFGFHPAGWSSTAEKMVARMTEMKVKKADAKASLESMSKVRGSEHSQEMIIMMTEKMTVLQVMVLASVIVLRYSAPMRTWRPWYVSRGWARISCDKPE